MGKYENGVLGKFTGKVGTVVGSTWKGKAVMRAKPPSKRTKASSPAQLEQQARFKLIANVLQPLADFMNVTYKKAAVGMSGLNKAIATNIMVAIAGVYPAFTVDFTKILLSQGRLPNVTAPAAASAAAGKLTITWTDNTGMGKALSSDLAYVAVYSADLDHWTYVQNAAARNSGTYTMDLTGLSGKSVQAYIGFFTADGKTVSTSAFVAQVNIT
jgi:hypothetical protein